MAVTVAVAVGAAGEALVAKTAERANTFTVGPGAAPGTDMGPLISEVALDRVRGALELSVAQGGRLVVDGRERPAPGAGYFIVPVSSTTSASRATSTAKRCSDPC
jgi:malonate-semialdehyde dehydrogenase (acetylating)/methylmalonate-semialdehyde dehydrogenase